MASKQTKILSAAIILLVAACAVEGFVIYRQKTESPKTMVDRDIDSFTSHLNDWMHSSRSHDWKMFDRFFDDDFFSGNKDPFSEMERLRKQMDDMMEKDMKDPFNRSWDSWFGDRFLGGGSDIDMDLKDKDDAYVVTLNIPHLKDNRLNVTIDEDGISVEGDYTQTAEKKDAQGHVTSKREIRRSISRHFSIPPDADHAHAKIKNESDRIVITLPKLPA